MPAYAYPITVNPEPKKIRYTKEIELPERLTLAILGEYVQEGETFTISDREINRFHSVSMLYISGERLETPEEVSQRVAKEEAYMTEYNRRKTVTNK